MSTKLTKSHDRMVSGVCGGIARYMNMDPTAVRIVFFLLVWAGGMSLWVYIILAFVMPNPD